MNTTKMIAIISALSLIGYTLCSCSANEKSNKSSDIVTTSDNESELEAAETTAATATAIQTTEAEETTEAATEPETKISEEEQSKINDACIACLTEFTKIECYNPYDYPYQYMLCDINEDGIDELIVHYMSMLGETEALYYYKDGEYSEIAFASESGFDICIEGHFVQFSSWDGRDSRNIIEIDGKEFKKDVISRLSEGYQHNDVDISEDEFNKLNAKYDSYKWEKPEFEDFSNILPESVAFPEIDLSSLYEDGTGTNNGGGISVDTIVGTWKASHYIENNQTKYFEDTEFGFVFYADGTGYLYNYQVKDYFTYVTSGFNNYTLYFSEDANPAPFHIEDGYLVSWAGYYYKRVN